MKKTESSKLIEQYGKYVFSGVELLPHIIQSGQGSFVTDVDGNRLMDLNAGQFCSVFGHSWAGLEKAVSQQLKKIAHTGTNTVSEDVFIAAKAVSDLCTGMAGRVIFLSTGAEAIECAMRFAKSVKGRNGFICFNTGYHGLSLGAQSVTFGGQWSLPRVEKVFSLTVPVFHELDESGTSSAVASSLNQLEDILSRNKDEIAAMIMEPIISVGGMNFLCEQYCEEIHRLCRKYGVFLLYDECQTGVGRTGKWFCYQHSTVVPDILITAKALGAGLPVSMVVFNGDTVDISKTPLTHYSSHQNDPLCAAIVLEVVEEIKQQDLLGSITQKGAFLLQRLELLSEKYEFIIRPRGKGLMLGFDIYRPGLTSYRQLSKDFSDSLLQNGLMLQSTSQGKTFRLLPNYMVSEEELELFIDRLEKTIINF